MIETLMTLVQGLCFAGYLYGAWLVISHSQDSASHGALDAEWRARRAEEEALAWRRYLACDA